MSLPIHREMPRLLLRTLLPEDASERYRDWLNDPEINQFLESRFVTHTVESTRAFVEALGDDHVAAAIVERASGEHIGNIKLGPIHPVHRSGDIGLLIGERRCWGRGYATEAIAGLTAHAFDELGLDKVTASAYSTNVASIAAFRRAGFELEGSRRGQMVSGDRRVDLVLVGCVRPDGAARPPGDPTART